MEDKRIATIRVERGAAVTLYFLLTDNATRQDMEARIVENIEEGRRELNRDLDLVVAALDESEAEFEG